NHHELSPDRILSDHRNRARGRIGRVGYGRDGCRELFLLARMVSPRQPYPLVDSDVGQSRRSVDAGGVQNPWRGVRCGRVDPGTDPVSAIAEAQLYLAAAATKGDSGKKGKESMRYVCVFAVLLSAIAANAQNGETVYKQHCASCHNSAAPRVPS